MQYNDNCSCVPKCYVYMPFLDLYQCCCQTLDIVTDYILHKIHCQHKVVGISYLPTSSIALEGDDPPVKLNWGVKTCKQLFRHKNRAVKACNNIFDITTRELIHLKH